MRASRVCHYHGVEIPEGFGSISKSVCLDHIVDRDLRRLLEPDADEIECGYCGRSGTKGDPAFAVAMDIVSEYVWEAANLVYAEATDIQWYDGEPFSEEALYETNDVIYDIFEDAVDAKYGEPIIESLKAAIYDRDYWTDNWNQPDFTYGWASFARTVRTESRFIYIGSSTRSGYENEPPARMAQFLKALLAYVESDLLVELPAGSVLYRGRMTDDASALKKKVKKAPSTELGSAPSHLADAGRLNAKGISLFYASDDVVTAVGEIALHSHYDDAVMGGFVTQRSFQVLDFTRELTKRPSIFLTDPDSRARWMFARFVKIFIDRITAPVLLDGRQLVDYTPTQVVAEYLRFVPDKRIDGIAWPSHVGAGKGKNVMLFIGHGTDFQTDPPKKKELAREGGSKQPALKLSMKNVTKHRVKRSVTVKPR